MRAVLALLSVIAGAAAAQEPPPEASVRPETRPASADEAPRPEGHANAPRQSGRESPAGDREDISADTDEPGTGEAAVDAEVPAGDDVAEQPAEPSAEERAVAPAAYRACLDAIDGLGVDYVEIEPIQDDDPACGIARPLEVRTLGPDITLDPPARVRCATARAAATWVADEVVPAASGLRDRGALVELRNGSAYICRRRNSAQTGRLSEHSFGNALDITAFVFERGEPIAIEPRADDGTLAEAFQRAVRAGACLHFTTVLGPGTDAAHADHLHLDLRRRDRDFRICQ